MKSSTINYIMFLVVLELVYAISSWEKVYRDSAVSTQVSFGVSMAHSDGSFTVLGDRGEPDIADYYYFISNIAVDGSITWTKEIHYKSNDYHLNIGSRISTLEEAVDSDVFITANIQHSHGGHSHDDLLFASFNKGNVVFSKILEAPTGYEYIGQDDDLFFGKMRDGNFIAVQQVKLKKQSGTTYSSLILKLNTNGDIIWKQIIGYKHSLLFRTVVEKNGYYNFFGNFKEEQTSSTSLVQVRLDANGKFHGEKAAVEYSVSIYDGIILTVHRDDEVVHTVDDGFVLLLTGVNGTEQSADFLVKINGNNNKVMWTKQLFNQTNQLDTFSFLKKNDDDTTNPVLFIVQDDHTVYISELDDDGVITHSRRMDLDYPFVSIVGQKRKSIPDYLILTVVLQPSSSFAHTKIYNIDIVKGACGMSEIKSIYSEAFSLDKYFDVSSIPISDMIVEKDFEMIIREENILETIDRDLTVDIDEYCFFCNNKYRIDRSGCSFRGKCVGQDNCLCENGRFGSSCEISKCFGKLSNDSKVCLGRGKCEDVNLCDCDHYSGYNCEYNQCWGKSERRKDVCNGHGKCIGFNRCECEPSWRKFGDCGTRKTYSQALGKKEEDGHVEEIAEQKETIIILAILLVGSGFWGFWMTMIVVGFVVNLVLNKMKEKKEKKEKEKVVKNRKKKIMKKRIKKELKDLDSEGDDLRKQLESSDFESSESEEEEEDEDESVELEWNFEKKKKKKEKNSGVYVELSSDFSVSDSDG